MTSDKMTSASSSTLATSATPQRLESDRAPFHILAAALERMHKTKLKEDKLRVLRNLLDNFKDRQNLFALVRCLAPHLDDKRTKYQLAQKNLAKMYTAMMGLQPNSEDARSLELYDKPDHNTTGYTGDFIGTFFHVVEKRSRPAETLNSRITLAQVNELLDQLADAASKESNIKEAREAVLRKMHTSMTAVEQKWAVCMILRELKIGVLKSILKVLHIDAEECYKASGDLEDVCAKCYNREVRVTPDGKMIQLFGQLAVKRAERVNGVDKVMQHIVRQMTNVHESFYVEEKLDGERLLLHWARGTGGGSARVEFWSRQKVNFTKHYRRLYAPGCDADSEHGIALGNFFLPNVDSVILDGEMMMYNALEDRFEAFGSRPEVMNHYKNNTATGKIRPCFMVFDILFFNGVSVIERQLSERKRILDEELSKRWLSRADGGMLELLPFEVVQKQRGVPAADQLMDAAMEKGAEGLVFKSPISPYVLGSKDSSWIKLKPDYLDKYRETLDVALVGGYYGQGSRAKTLSGYLIAARAPECEEQRFGKGPLFYPIGKVATGFSVQQRADMSQRLGAPQPWIRGKAPEHLCGFCPNRDDLPDKWYKPEHVQVIEVAFFELHASGRFSPSQWVPRFPRIVRARPDKTVEDVIPYQEIVDIAKGANGRARMREKQSPEPTPPPKRQRRVGAAVAGHLVTSEAINDVQCKKQVFCGKNFCFVGLGGHAERSMDGLKVAAKELGASIVENPGDTTSYVIDVDSEPGYLVQRLMSSEKAYEIVTADWLLDCRRQLADVGLEPRYIRRATTGTKVLMERRMDCFGDSFTKAATMETLARCLETVGGAVVEEDVVADIGKLDDETAEMLLRDSTHAPLRSVVAYVPLQMKAARLRARMLGARLVDTPTANVSHAILSSETRRAERDAIRATLREARIEAHVDFREYMVSERWLEDCAREGRMVEAALPSGEWFEDGCTN